MRKDRIRKVRLDSFDEESTDGRWDKEGAADFMIKERPTEQGRSDRKNQE